MNRAISTFMFSAAILSKSMISSAADLPGSLPPSNFTSPPQTAKSANAPSPAPLMKVKGWFYIQPFPTLVNGELPFAVTLCYVCYFFIHNGCSKSVPGFVPVHLYDATTILRSYPE